MSIKNPFQILGFNQEIIGKLPDEKIKELIRSNYRKLQQFYHPDKPSGDKKMSIRLTEAYNLLTENEETYQAIKKSFLKKSSQKKRISELEEKLEEINKIIESTKSDAEDLLMNYFLSISKDSIPVFNLPDLHISMFDYGTAINRSYLANINPYPRDVRGNVQASREDVFFEYRIQKGMIYKVHKGKTKELQNKIFIGSIDEKTVEEYGNFRNILKRTQEISPPSSQEYSRLLYGRKDYSRRDVNYFHKNLQPYEFKTIVSLISPKITEKGHLFSVIINNEKPTFFYDGKIIKIERV